MSSSVVYGLTEVHAQLSFFIYQLNPKAYAEPLSCLGGNSIGKHCRHILEIFDNLAKGLSKGQVDYETRERNVIYETDPIAFIEKLTDLIQELCTRDFSSSITVIHQPFPNLLEEETFSTTLGRELLYNLEHMIHHMAIIRLGAESANLGSIIPSEFGVAFSTLRFQEQLKNVHA
ncbi:MAG: hypothetical protein LPK45_08295 [Bacteroidota bacterium]|nr:hypothetical protein [Bacteroidota bacterium]MDX5431068.1 hypothetical protein [Bacteroidota bacterium]MDX5469822.1 hypothetical protein [Bacteroidota bacterium]